MADQQEHDGKAEQLGYDTQLTPRPSQPRNDQKESKKERPKDFDPFYLEQIFPDPKLILTYTPPPIAEIAKDCVFVLDTNALLAPFSIGKDSFTELADILRKLAKAKRLAVPAQAVREFAKNRADKIREVHTYVLKLTTSFPTFRVDVPMLQNTAEYKAVVEAIEKLKKPLDEYKEKVQSLLAHVRNLNWNDDVSRLFSEVLATAVIDHGQARDAILGDLARRNTHKVPPGYKDAGKDDGGIGDLLIWQSILSAGKDLGKNIIFVTNDQKADWTVRSGDEPLGPRYELVEEFRRTSGAHFSLVQFGTFLKLTGASPKTINEAELAAAVAQVLETVAPYNLRGNLLNYVTSMFRNFHANPVADLDTFSDPEFRKAAVQFAAELRSYADLRPGSALGRSKYLKLAHYLEEIVELSDKISGTADQDEIEHHASDLLDLAAWAGELCEELVTE